MKKPKPKRSKLVASQPVDLFPTFYTSGRAIVTRVLGLIEANHQFSSPVALLQDRKET